MRRAEVKCQGVECVFFLQQYVPMQYQGGWIPNFSLSPDKYCTHPTMRPQHRDVETTQGRSINNMSICPLTENENA